MHYECSEDSSARKRGTHWSATSAAPGRASAILTGAAGIGVQGYREMADALWRQDYHVQQMEELVAWTERIIRSRDRALSFMDQELKLYQGTTTQKVMLILRRIYRTLRRDARQIMNKLRRDRQKPIEMQ